MAYNLNILQYIVVILNTLKDASEYLSTLTIRRRFIKGLAGAHTPPHIIDFCILIIILKCQTINILNNALFYGVVVMLLFSNL